jgi:H+/Cl- antiporter ClcA
MIDAQARPKSYLRLMSLVVLLGIVSAALSFIFMALVQEGTHLVWDHAQAASGLDPRLFTITVCTVGGLLVGLLLKLLGDHNAIFADLMVEFGKTGRFDYRHAPSIVINALVSLIAGASLGPEAPLADMCGGLGTLVSDKLKLDDRETRAMGYGGFSAMLAALITNAFGGAVLGLETAQVGGTGLQIYFWSLFPSLLASAAAAIVFVQLTGAFFAKMFTFPQYTPRLQDLLMAVPLSLAGAMTGVLFMRGLRRMQDLMQPLKEHLILRAIIGGLAMGLIGALLPLDLFSGESQAPQLIQNATAIGAWMLIALAFSKLLATSVLLSTGWKGGYIFPILFATVGIGAAINLIFPAIPVAVTVAATLAGALVAAVRAPLFAALFTLQLVQAETGPVIAVAVIVSALLAAFLALRAAQRTQAVQHPESLGTEA